MDTIEISKNNDSWEVAQILVNQAKQRLEEISNNEGLSGVPTGFRKLDDLTSGLQPSNLIVIAGRPSSGKTSFVLSMVRNIALSSKIPVALFSQESTSLQLITRLISSETGLSSDKLRKGTLESYEWELLNVKVKDLEKAPLYIDDTPLLSVFDLAIKARNLLVNHGIEVLVIDNLQLMAAGNNGKGDINREHEISIIVRNLKALARELNIPIVAVSQLSREIEIRDNIKRPYLSDLRGSGTIEDIADIVSFIYRPEYYKIDTWDDEEAAPTDNQAEFIVAKHRNGSLDNIRLNFNSNTGKFGDLDELGTYDNSSPSKMNLDSQQNPFLTPNLPSPNDAFGSSMNSSFDENSDVPF